MKRTELKRRTPLRQGDARLKRAALKPGKGIKAKPKRRTRDVSDYLNQNGTCEVTWLLNYLDPPGWAEFKRVWAGHPEENVLDPHHIYNRSEGDAVWNLTTVRRVAHEFIQGTPVGRLVCVLAKEKSGKLCREDVIAKTRRDPLGLIANDRDNGRFTGRCETAAYRLLRRHSVPAITVAKAKKQAHSAFDPLWEEDGWDRSEAYRWLARRLGINPEKCHISEFDITTCRRVVAV